MFFEVYCVPGPDRPSIQLCSVHYIEVHRQQCWTFGIGSGAHLLVNGLIDVTREMAEHDATEPRS